MHTRKQLSLLLSVLLGGMSLVSLAGAISIFLIRAEILHLSRQTSPAQVKLAKLQRDFERVGGLFARTSSASSQAEVASIGGELSRTMTEIEQLSRDLSRTAVADDNSSVIAKLSDTGAQLRVKADARMQGRQRIAEATRRVSGEIESVVSVTKNFVRQMNDLQQSSQGVLLSSKTTNMDANTNIKALLSSRAKIEQLRSIVLEVRSVDKKYRLNVTKEKAHGVADALLAEELGDKALTQQLKSFVASFASAFEGDAGLIAARASVLSTPEDTKSRATYEERQKATTGLIEAMSGKIAESIDPLELAVSKANSGMNEATELIQYVAAVSDAASELNAGARSLQALASQLLVATDAAAVDRVVVEIESLGARNNSLIAKIAEMLPRLQQGKLAPALADLRLALGRAEQMLIANGGVAALVKQGIHTQTEAEDLFAAALQSIQEIARAGSNRARDAEGAQESSVARISTLSGATLLLVGITAAFALSAGTIVGNRVRGGILRAEQQLHSADEMTSLLKRVRSGADDMRSILGRVRGGIETLRNSSRGLLQTSEVVIKNVESMEGGAGHLQVSIRNIAQSAADALETGEGAAALVDSASVAVAALTRSNEEIAKVTEIIRNIAFSTKLLGLNAAIEAAHAGDQGNSFMIIAHEVKTLANSAANATTQIDHSIRSMAEHVGKVSFAMESVFSIILEIRSKQDTITSAVQAQTAATDGIISGIQQTAAGCRGWGHNEGLYDMAVKLSHLAEDLEKLCAVH